MPLPAVAAAIRRNVHFGLGRACIVARHKDERVYVAADSADECEAHSSFLTTLAKRHQGVSMQEIHDALNTMLAHDLADDDLELLGALTQMRRDEEVISAIWERGPTTIELVAIADHYRGCVEWFATHASDPVTHQRMMAALAEHDALRAENAERALRQLERSERRKVNGNGQAH
jgi:hypothetical protein